MEVYNSALFSRDVEQNESSHNSLYNNFGLKTGIVTEVIFADDPSSVSKRNVEYNVFVFEKQGRNATVSSTYKNCNVMESFGGVADFLEATLRSTRISEVPTPKEAIGSMVLLLCVNGNVSAATILGTIHNPNRKTKSTKENGHRLEGEFNGVNWNINKEGELTVTFKTETDVNGKPKDEKKGGTFFKMDKTGSIILSDNNKESITIDKTKKTISVLAESDILINSQANIKTTSKANTEMSCKDLLAAVEGRASFAIKGELSLKSDGSVAIKGASVKIESDGSVEIKGSSAKIAAQSIELGEGGTPAVTMSTMVMGIGNLGAPVMSSMIGPYSSVVKIAT